MKRLAILLIAAAIIMALMGAIAAAAISKSNETINRIDSKIENLHK